MDFAHGELFKFRNFSCILIGWTETQQGVSF